MSMQEFERFTTTDPSELSTTELATFAARALAAANALRGSTDADDTFDRMFMLNRRDALLREIGNRATDRVDNVIPLRQAALGA